MAGTRAPRIIKDNHDPSFLPGCKSPRQVSFRSPSLDDDTRSPRDPYRNTIAFLIHNHSTTSTPGQQILAMSVSFESLTTDYTQQKALDFLSALNLQLGGYVVQESEVDYILVLGQLNELIRIILGPKSTDNKGKDAESAADRKFSPNVARLLSRNVTNVLKHLPSKIYDLANELSGHLTLEENGRLTGAGRLASIVLIDIFENYPLQISSLTNFIAGQLYKMIKADSLVDSNVVYLASCVIRAALRSDIDEKTLAKWVKLILKIITLQTVSVGGEEPPLDKRRAVTVYSLKCFISLLKNALILSVSSNYQHLLEFSASASSGSKLKPDAIMTQQNQYQTAILKTHDKLFQICLLSQLSEIRAAMTELLANLLISFVNTGKFDAIEYLINFYPLPNMNLWDESLMYKLDQNEEPIIERRVEKNLLPAHDSDNVVNANANLLFLQIGCVETFIAYTQLEQIQDLEYLSNTLTSTLNSILEKFRGLDNLKHIQNQQWVRTLSHWSKAVKILVVECGVISHDMLAQYVITLFGLAHDDSILENTTEAAVRPAKDKKRESSLFSFKSLKKTTKDTSRSLISPYLNSYQNKLILDLIVQLLPFGIDFNALTAAEDKLPRSLIELDDTGLADEDENELTSKKYSYVSSLFLLLLINDCEYIRNNGLDALLAYARVNDWEANQLILEVFLLVSQEFAAFDHAKDSIAHPTDRNITKSVSVKLYTYALTLLSLIELSSATMLQNSTIAKLLSFCTQNLKQSVTGPKSTKNGACWIILSSLVTFYPDSEFVKLNSSQFLVFWKNLLTSQFVSSAISAENNFDNVLDVFQNLKLRTLSLKCLLNYILAVKITPELSKQLQFLLVKAQKYLLYLESNFESIGAITSFTPQNFNENDFNPNSMSNVLFCDRSESSQVPFANKLTCLILYSKKIVIQGFIKLAHFIKGDISSSMVVFLTKVFSDPKLFSRLSLSEYNKEKTKSISKNKEPLARLAHEDRDMFFLDEEYNYNFGVTSKFRSDTAELDELNVDKLRSPGATLGSVLEDLATENSDKPIFDVKTWIDAFESDAKVAATHSFNYDPLVIAQTYLARHESPTNLITSLIDNSIELFQLVFSTLSYKIQFSLLEQLRNSLAAKNVDPKRRIAFMINISVAIDGLLTNTVKRNTQLNEDLIELVLEILDSIETQNRLLVTLNADSVGKASQMLSKAKCEDLVAKSINKIVNDVSPYRRGYLLLSLAKIYCYSHCGFSEIYGAVSQLMNDPHPVMAFYSLSAATYLFENTMNNRVLVQEMFVLIILNFLAGHFDCNPGNDVFVNLRSIYPVTFAVTKLLRVLLTSLGPSIKELDSDFKFRAITLIFSFYYGFGCFDLSEYSNSVSEVIRTCQEMLVYDPKIMDGFLSWFKDVCEFVIKSNIKLGVGISGPTSLQSDAIFPLTTSYALEKLAFLSLVDMTKLRELQLNKSILSLAWILMELLPCVELEQLISFWVESNSEAQWFGQLLLMFDTPSKKLVGQFLDTHFQQKLLPLLQRQKKQQVAGSVELGDEESKTIVEEHDLSAEKSSPINWEFKLFIYESVIGILSRAADRPSLKTELIPKIQEIVRLAFLGTTSSIPKIRIRGVEILDKALELFGYLEDPLFPGNSILEQQQAQIISALIPCFSADSQASLMVNAINVSSKFINLPRIKFYSKQRILKTMIYLLEEISSGKYLKFVFLESIAEYGRKSIQLAILNCWAVLHLNQLEQDENTDPEFEEILKKYSALLISLWILTLKDLSSLKYSQPKSRELDLYSGYWLNFVGVLSLLLERNDTLINEFLKEEEEDFFFVMFCQCFEALIKNQDVPRVLISVSRLVKIPALAKNLLSDDTFGEVIDLLDRLIVMEKNYLTRCTIVEIVSTLFEHAATSASSQDKLFELLRVAMLPLFEIFPFLRQDYNPEDASQKLLMKKFLDNENVTVAKRVMQTLVQMAKTSPVHARPDLYACLLYVLVKVYELGDETLISAVLPFLKSIVTECQGHDLTNLFYQVLRKHESFNFEAHRTNYVITLMILVTSGGISLSEQEASEFSDQLLSMISDEGAASTAVQSIRTLIAAAAPGTISLILKSIVTSLFETIESGKSEAETRLSLEILMRIAESGITDTEEKTVAFLGLLVPTLVSLEQQGLADKHFLREKMMTLLQKHPESCKKVISGLLEAEKQATENLVRFGQEDAEQVGENDAISLKTFG